MAIPGRARTSCGTLTVRWNPLCEVIRPTGFGSIAAGRIDSAWAVGVESGVWMVTELVDLYGKQTGLSSQVASSRRAPARLRCYMVQNRSGPRKVPRAHSLAR